MEESGSGEDDLRDEEDGEGELLLLLIHAFSVLSLQLKKLR